MVVLAAGLALKLGHVHGPAPFEDPDVSDVHMLYVQRQLNVGATPYLDYRPYDPSASPKPLPPGATQSAGWVEYPVGIGAAMWAAAQPAHNADQFLLVTAIGLSAAALLTVVLLAPTGPRAYLFAASPVLLVYAFHNWDLLPVAAVTAAITALRNQRTGAAGALLGAGAILKIYPLLLVPAFVASRWLQGDRRGAATLAGAAAAVVMAANLPIMLANYQGWRTPYTFQQNRPPDINSVWFWMHHHFTISNVNLASGALTAALVIAGVICVRYGASPVAVAAATIAGTIAIGKVASPQYALWLLPFFALLTVRLRWWVLFTVSELIFWSAFFAQGYLGTHGSGYVEPAVFLRAIVLAALIPVFLLSRDVLPLRATEHTT